MILNKKKKKWEKLWNNSLDLYATAFKVSADGWAEAMARITELEQENKILTDKLTAERKKHRADVQLLTEACEGSTSKRQELVESVKRLKAENVRLSSENKRVNTALDIISARNNAEVIEACFEEMEGV